MRQSQGSDGTVKGRVGVEEGEREEAPHFHDAPLPGRDEVLPVPGQHDAVDVVRVGNVPQELPVHRVRHQVALVVVNGREGLSRQDDVLRAPEGGPRARLQGPEEVPEGGVNQNQPVTAPRHDETHLGGDGNGCDGRLVTRQRRPRRGALGRLPYDRLCPSVPVPQEDGAILRAGGDVAVGRDVALGPAQAGHDPKVTVDDLGDFG